jgi:glycosyltransferase involved in cell wall biosynthesis
MLDLSIVIPVYRSQDSLRPLFERIVATLTNSSWRFEVIFVEDCGGDDSWRVIEQLSQQDVRVRALQMSRNYGQHNAILAGVRAAVGKLIVTLDDDLQHPPESIPKLIEKINEGYDVVYAPPIAEQHGVLRNFASQITKNVLQGAMGAETAKHVSAYRIFRAKLRDAFAQCQNPSINMDVLLTWGTTKFATCPVQHDARPYGESGYTARKLIRHAFNMMTGFSTAPLKLASLLGFVFASFGVLILIYVIVLYFIAGNVAPGFPFIASIVAIFSGIQLLALGIMGEYLARMHQRTMEKPCYVVANVLGDAALNTSSH